MLTSDFIYGVMANYEPAYETFDRLVTREIHGHIDSAKEELTRPERNTTT
jgi:hypothetical protein